MLGNWKNKYLLLFVAEFKKDSSDLQTREKIQNFQRTHNSKINALVKILGNVLR